MGNKTDYLLDMFIFITGDMTHDAHLILSL